MRKKCVSDPLLPVHALDAESARLLEPDPDCLCLYMGEFVGSGYSLSGTRHPIQTEPLRRDFLADLRTMLDGLRMGPLQSFRCMALYCAGHPEARMEIEGAIRYGFHVETERYRYGILLTPSKREKQLAIYCHSKEECHGH